VRPAIFLAFEIEAWHAAEDVEPGRGIAADFDLSFLWAERVEGLIEQIAHHAGLWFLAGGADIADRQVVVDAHVALHEASHLPRMPGAIVAFEDEDVAAACRADVAFAFALTIGMGEGGTDGVSERRSIRGLGRADAIGQTSLFHGASCRTA
jgi:hypothetical protein